MYNGCDVLGRTSYCPVYFGDVMVGSDVLTRLPPDMFLTEASGYMTMHARPVIIGGEMGRN
jgi:hypothetical protein